MKNSKPFKKKFSFAERREKSLYIMKKYPNRIAVIVEKDNCQCSELPDLMNKRLLLPNDITFGHFIYILRARLYLEKEKALFIFINNTIPCSSTTLQSIYDIHKESDNFLYCTYSTENTFG